MRNYFTDEEQKCKCCGKGKFSSHLLLKANNARELSGIPYVVTSGARCEKHNADEGGKKDSAHVIDSKGDCYGFDIQAKTSTQRFRILSGLIKAGFSRIGISKTFIHADCKPGLPLEVTWLY